VTDNVSPARDRKSAGSEQGSGGGMNKVTSILVWAGVATVGAFSFAALALGRGEHVNAVWLVTAALATYFIAYQGVEIRSKSDERNVNLPNF
jgi:hypothetical protein